MARTYPPRRTAGDRPYIPTPMQIEELAMDARKAAAERWKVVAADAAASLKVVDAAEEVIIPPRTRSSNRGRGASSSNRTSTTTTTTAAAAAAVPTAPADASVVVAAAMGTSAGCLTSAAQRIGVPIPDLRIPMRVATRAEDDANKFIGSCNYIVSGSNHCSHPDLLLRMCNHGMCRIRIHHLCQLEWEEAMGYEETTISRCQLHHPRVLGVPPPIPNAQVPVATMPTLPPITITKQRYNMCDTPPESQLTLDSDFDLNDDISFSGGGVQGGGENEVEGEEEEDAGVDGAELATLGSVFECDRINIKRMNDKEGWECGWCGVFFSPRHATRALKHVLKIKKGGIGVCKAVIPPQYLARYTLLNGQNYNRIETSKRTIHQIDLSVESTQQSAVSSLLQKRGHAGALSVTSTPTVTRLRGSTTPFERSSFALSSGSQQRTMSSVNMDIRQSNNASVQMAIADFFHCQNIPDAVVETPEFKRLVRQCRLVDNNFVIPNKKKIGGELLDINFANISAINKANLLKEAAVFGVVIMGDGATIHRMPLLNILAMSGSTPPLTVGIVDCTKHMAAGGKKDATYIAEIFEDKVEEYDPNHTLTDLFFFDGASNVQKAGEVLMAKYPRTFCCHGGEHVVALFFTSLSKIKPIKV